MKKLNIILIAIIFLLTVSGIAMASFESGKLIRVVYQSGGTYEVATDLGLFAPTSAYAGSNMSLTSNRFPVPGSGAFSTASWSDLYVAYFVYLPGAAWTSGLQSGQTSGNRQFANFESAANSVLSRYASLGSGAHGQLDQSDLQSYYTKMDKGGPSAGTFSGFIPQGGGEQNLADLGTTGYADQYLYYYGTPNSPVAGLQVAQIRTFADGHTEIYSLLEPANYSLNVNNNPSNGGTVTGDGISCPGTCSSNYSEGTQITLTASADSGYVFSSWSGCNVSEGPVCYVTMNEDKTVTANYQTSVPEDRTLTVASSNPNSGVSITVSPNDKDGQGNGTTQFTRTYDDMTQVTLTAPETAGGNTFLNWTGCTAATGTACNVTMESSKTVTANYEPPAPAVRTLTIASSNPNSGVSITVSPNDKAGQGNGTTQFTRTYDDMTQVTLTAASSTGGNNFVNWSGCTSASDTTCSVTMNGDKTVTANYQQQISAGPDLTGSWTSLNQSCRSGKCVIRGRLNVQNIGTEPASSSVRFYFSQDNNFDGADTFLREIRTGKLNAGRSKNMNLNHNFPSGISATDKYIIAVIDEYNTVTEMNESNNVMIYGAIPRPDLTGEWVSMDQQCKDSKSGIRCMIKGKFNVQNIGYQDADSTTLQFYLSEDGSYDVGDTMLREIKTSILKSGRSKISSLNHTLPAGIDSSGKYIIAVIDAENSLTEADENNNNITFGPMP